MKNQLLKLISYLGLTASRFAEEIRVQRSGISHILSGRNQPSYDFIVKIIKRYPEISPEWLLLGKGSMLRKEAIEISDKRDLFPEKNSQNEKLSWQDLEQAKEKNENDHKNDMKVTYVNTIEQVIVLYSDGTFKPYLHSVADKI